LDAVHILRVFERLDLRQLTVMESSYHVPHGEVVDWDSERGINHATVAYLLAGECILAPNQLSPLRGGLEVPAFDSPGPLVSEHGVDLALRDKHRVFASGCDLEDTDG